MQREIYYLRQMATLTSMEVKILRIFYNANTAIIRTDVVNHLKHDHSVLKVNEHTVSTAIAKFVQSDMISEIPPRSGIYKISLKGKMIFEDEMKMRNAEREEKDLVSQKLKYDVVNAERVFKTYGTTRAITWITFIVMLILSFLKLAESVHIWPYHPK